MDAAERSKQWFTEMSTLASKSAAFWTGAGQRAWNDAAALASSAVTEGIRLSGSLQSQAFDAAKAGWEYWANLAEQSGLKARQALNDLIVEAGSLSSPKNG